MPKPTVPNETTIPVAVFDDAGNSPNMLNWGADGIIPGNVTGSTVMAEPYLFNGSTVDRQRGNVTQTVFASAARTASIDSADLTNYNGRGLHLVIDVTAIAATPSVVFSIQAKDPISGKYYNLLSSSAITGVGTTVLRIYPGLLVVANLASNDVLPRVFRVSAAHGDADSITYSVAASVIL